MDIVDQIKRGECSFQRAVRTALIRLRYRIRWADNLQAADRKRHQVDSGMLPSRPADFLLAKDPHPGSRILDRSRSGNADIKVSRKPPSRPAAEHPSAPGLPLANPSGSPAGSFIALYTARSITDLDSPHHGCARNWRLWRLDQNIDIHRNDDRCSCYYLHNMIAF